MASHRNYGKNENNFADKLMSLETNRAKIKLDRLNLKQAYRDKRAVHSQNTTAKIFNSISAYNPEYEKPENTKVPFGSGKKSIKDMHEHLKAIDANQYNSISGSPRDKAVWRDHVALVGHKRGAGVFSSGKSVPKARPTMFWEA